MRNLANPPQKINEYPRTKRSIVATYPYQDERGNLLFETVRYTPKSFTQRRPNPINPGWIYNLEATRRVLFRLPQVIEAVKEGKR